MLKMQKINEEVIEKGISFEAILKRCKTIGDLKKLEKEMKNENWRS